MGLVRHYQADGDNWRWSDTWDLPSHTLMLNNAQTVSSLARQCYQYCERVAVFAPLEERQGGSGSALSVIQGLQITEPAKPNPVTHIGSDFEKLRQQYGVNKTNATQEEDLSISRLQPWLFKQQFSRDCSDSEWTVSLNMVSGIDGHQYDSEYVSLARRLVKHAKEILGPEYSVRPFSQNL